MKYVKLLYLLEAGLCFLFFYYSEGLAFPSGEDGSYQFVKELYSSGSEDDIAIFVVGLVCLLTSLILLISKSIRFINAVVVVSMMFQLLSLILIQMGSIYYTLFFAWNIYLHGIVLSQLIILFIVIKVNVNYGGKVAHDVNSVDG